MRRISFFLVFLTACATSYKTKSVQYNDYRIASTMQADSQYIRMLKPYGDSVRTLMNMPVGHLDQSMEKGANGGSLGNFMADAFLTQARLIYKKQVDVSFMNYGGIRLTDLPVGKITRNAIFELMPFDNSLILVKAKGEELQQFLDLISKWGGWPCAGMTMEIKDKKAVNVLVAGKPLNSQEVYTIAISDFIANGGDNAAMLKNLPRENKNYLVRDALMDYVAAFEKQGLPVSVNNETRVSNVK